jgi:hypothetical protein
MKGKYVVDPESTKPRNPEDLDDPWYVRNLRNISWKRRRGKKNGILLGHV